MHRIPSWFYLFSAAALYVSGAGAATPQNSAAPQLQLQLQSETEVQSEVTAQPSLQIQPPSQPAAQLSDGKPVPHIALLLPLKSAAFGRAAEAVQMGFLAAANSQPDALPIKVYGSFDESKDIVTLYQAAVSNGAVAVAGPLTRDGVAALTSHGKINVPTLALNLAENKDSGQLYFFGLPMEAEARQVAQLAAAAKLRYATIVSTATPLTKRLSQAFAEEWKALGGSVTAEVLFNDDLAALALLPTAPGDIAPDPNIQPASAPPAVAPGNMVFLAADTEKARLIRPYLNASLPVYATSQLFNGNADTLVNYDLNDIRFVDMPWLLQPDHPAVMVYPRADPPLEPDRERLYALGIDAFRLVQILLSKNWRSALPLDGVTGHISLISNNQFRRDAIPAQIRQGRSQPPAPLPRPPALQPPPLGAGTP